MKRLLGNRTALLTLLMFLAAAYLLPESGKLLVTTQGKIVYTAFANDVATFQVAPVDDWVGPRSPWTPGATISLTIEDGSGVVYSDSQNADSEGNFHFGLGGMFDLQRGHVVTVSDGTTTKTHTVMNLYVDVVDPIIDVVIGRADAGTTVEVWVQDGGGMSVSADGDGDWLANFFGITDITYLSDGASSQNDDDGDATMVFWSNPRFEVNPRDDWVQSRSPWTSGATISLTIEDGSGVVYSDSQPADSMGNFHFGLGGMFDLQRGHVVTVSDGTTTKTHTVMNLYVDGVDVTADTVFGRADAGTTVEVWVHHGGGQMTAADGAGNWTADFSGITDITYLSDGASSQNDDDGDATMVFWVSPNVAPVAIDVKPGDDRNCLNMNGHGVIPVAILGSMEFNVAWIDASSLRFNGLSVRSKRNGRLQCSFEDVSGDFTYEEGAPDGYYDLICMFEDDLSVWNPSNGTGTVTGNLTDGTPIVGSDSICLVP